MNGNKESRTELLFKEKWRQINPYFRDDYTDDQRKISLIERIDQVLNDVTVNCPEAFLVDKTKYSGKTILIIDDICTSGATFGSMIGELKKNGIEDIICLSTSAPD